VGVKVMQNVRDLSAAAAVAVVVALASTMAGSVLDHIHQVDAETVAATEKPAKAGPDGMQTLNVADWGVSLTVPLAAEMPLLTYTDHGGTSIGLSAADLTKVSTACTSSKNALGSIVQLAAGSYIEAATRGNWHARFINTINSHDYVYLYPQTACTEKAEAVPIVNREVSIITEAMDSLAAN